MSTLDLLSARLALFVLRILGNKKVTLNQVKAMIFLNSLKEEILGDMRKRGFHKDAIGLCLIKDFETSVDNAKACIKGDFSEEDWMKAVEGLKAHALESHERLIVSYASTIYVLRMADGLFSAEEIDSMTKDIQKSVESSLLAIEEYKRNLERAIEIQKHLP